MEGTLAEIRMFAGNFAPRGWQLCNGQLLSIAQWTAVFALVGTVYGGDGQNTFGVPDFRGRTPLGASGQGPGLPNYQLGEKAGTPTVTMTAANLPIHTHTISGNLTPKASRTGTLSSDPTGRNIGPGNFYADASDNVSMASIPTAGLSMSALGNNLPISIMKPYLGMNFIFCVEGIFPSRN